MNPPPKPDFLQRIDPICDQFEQACQRGQQPEILPLLEGWEGPSRTALFRHLLGLRIDYHLRAGKRPSFAKVIQEFPEFATVVKEVFQADAGRLLETSAGEQLADTHLPASKPPQPVTISHQLGRYRILRVLGEGGMGSVYLAHDSELDRQVALKVPKFFAGKDEELIKRFYREARAAAALHHRNICPVFDIGEVDGTRYITMAYVDGQSLADRLTANQPLPPEDAARLIAKLATALAEAHRHNVVHRDLKPSNIMIDGQGEPVIMDFGLARQVNQHDATQLTQSGMIIGTPAYMAPEQTSGRAEDIGPACDIYSLGVVFFQLLTGRLPFEGDLMSLLSKIANEQPPAFSSLDITVSSGLEAICQRMMAKSASDRFASMDEVATNIRDYLSPDIPPTIRVAKTVQTARVRKPKQRSALPLVIGGVGALAAMLIVVIVVAAAFWLRGPSPVELEPSPDKEPPAATRANVNHGVAPPIAVIPFDAPQARQHQINWAKYLGVEAEVTNSLGMNMALIPPGEFQMGSTDEEIAAASEEARALNLGEHYVEYIEAEGPQREETVSEPFYMGATEVTVGQFKQFVAATDHQTTAETNGLGGYGFVSREQAEDFNWRNTEMDQDDRHPVVNITLADAEQFCHWLSRREGVKYSLPTEVQWEFACRAGTTSRWSCGDEAALDKHAWHWDNSDHTTHPVGTKLSNNFRLYDMHGNVREWCARIKGAPETGIVRGGAFLKPPLLLRSSQRIAFKAVTPYPYHGFRVIRPAQATSE